MGKKSSQKYAAQPPIKASKRKVSSSSSGSSSDEPNQKKFALPLRSVSAKAIPTQEERKSSKAKVSKKKERKPSSSSLSSSSDDEPAQHESKLPVKSVPELASETFVSSNNLISPVKPLAQRDKVATPPINPTFENKKKRKVFTRVEVDPTKQYKHHESRDSWGANVNGKKFRKEKGKKKRCPNSGLIIDGAVRSTRLDN